MLDLTIRDFDGEPRMRDLEIAEALEFKRPRKIRELIGRYKPDFESFGDVIRVSERVSPHGGAKPPETDVGGRPEYCYWLNEEQALFLCTRSEARGAVALTKQMVMVFAAWRNGHLESPRHGGAPDDRELSLREQELWLSKVREARLLGGPKPAMRLWAVSPFEQVFDGPDASLVSEDVEIIQFLQEFCLVTGERSDFVPARDVVAQLQAWIQDVGAPPMTHGTAARRIKALSERYRDPLTNTTFRRHKRHGDWGYIGLKLRSSE